MKELLIENIILSVVALVGATVLFGLLIKDQIHKEEK